MLSIKSDVPILMLWYQIFLYFSIDGFLGQVLWPDGTFFVRLNAQNETDDFQSNEGSFQTTNRGSKVSQPGTFELQLEAARRASDVKKMIFSKFFLFVSFFFFFLAWCIFGNWIKEVLRWVRLRATFWS